MKKVIVLSARIVMCWLLISCELQKEKNELSSIVLTEQNQKIADNIYSNIDKWETKLGGSMADHGRIYCKNCFLIKVYGNMYLECVYLDTKIKYFLITQNSLKAANPFPEHTNYIASVKNMNIIYNEYNSFFSDNEKHEFAENLVREMQDPQKFYDIYYTMKGQR